MKRYRVIDMRSGELLPERDRRAGYLIRGVAVVDNINAWVLISALLGIVLAATLLT